MTASVRTAKLHEKSLMEDLLQAYLEEFSTITEVEQHPDGSFRYPYFDYYWNDPARLPFLIREEDQITGFALIRNEMDPSNGQPLSHMAEFYVIPELRRTGVGRAAAVKLWDMFPGIWIVEILKSNSGAYQFWQRVVLDYTGGTFDEADSKIAKRQWSVFTFPSKSPLDIVPDTRLLDF